MTKEPIFTQAEIDAIAAIVQDEIQAKNNVEQAIITQAAIECRVVIARYKREIEILDGGEGGATSILEEALRRCVSAIKALKPKE